jgi:hypothetical protein
MHVRRCFNFPDRRLVIHDCGKLIVLERLVKILRKDGHRALIFSQFTAMLDILERFLAIIGATYFRIDGSTKPSLRQAYADNFNANPKVFCMVLSTRSGGIGLNLTGADTVIFYDSDWNPSMDLQAQDRCHRIGQTRPVTIYRLISHKSVEEKILQKARERKMLNNVVIRAGQFHAIAELVGGDSATQNTSDFFAAISERVNLRSYFHDLDEDAVIEDDQSPRSDQGYDSSAGKTDHQVAATVLQELALVEDAEDRLALQRAENELRDIDEQARQDEDEDEDTDERAFARLNPAAESLIKTGDATARRRKSALLAGKPEVARWMALNFHKLCRSAAQDIYEELKESFRNLPKIPPFPVE